MVKEEAFFRFLFSNKYCIFISSNPIYEKTVDKIGGTFIRAVNNKCSCGIAVGLKFAGIRSVVILEEDIYEFIYTCLTICDNYSISIVGITTKDISKVKEVTGYLIADGYENKVKKRLKESDNNINSLLLGLEAHDE